MLNLLANSQCLGKQRGLFPAGVVTLFTEQQQVFVYRTTASLAWCPNLFKYDYSKNSWNKCQNKVNIYFLESSIGITKI